MSPWPSLEPPTEQHRERREFKLNWLCVSLTLWAPSFSQSCREALLHPFLTGRNQMQTNRVAKMLPTSEQRCPSLLTLWETPGGPRGNAWHVFFMEFRLPWTTDDRRVCHKNLVRTAGSLLMSDGPLSGCHLSLRWGACHFTNSYTLLQNKTPSFLLFSVASCKDPLLNLYQSLLI